MTVQRGRDLLLKCDIDGAGRFETIAGLRATRLSFNAESVDVTNVGSAGRWRELLAGAGMRSASITGSGVFRDGESDERVRSAFFDGETPVFRVIIPDFGIVEGRFQITGIEYAGAVQGEATFEISLASAGALVFTPDVPA